MHVPLPISSASLLLAFFESTVPAGFPSPAADHTQKRIDLTEELVMHPEATFLVRVMGDSMINVGLFEGDAMLVDRALKPVHGSIVLAVVDGEFTVKRLYKRGKTVKLLPENDAYAPIEFVEGQEMYVWGVVTQSFRAHFVKSKKRNGKVDP